MTEICGFADCGREVGRHGAKGLCSRHTWQLYQGRDLTPVKTRVQPMKWLLAHVNYEGDDCLKWPFSTNEHGRGQVKVGKKNWLAPRYMCKMSHGEPPTPEHEAAHSCGKGHEGCINPKHLRWATILENKADMIVHGTRPWGERQGGHKLTEVDVIAIRILAMTRTNAEVASEFGIARQTVSGIYCRRSWGHI